MPPRPIVSSPGKYPSKKLLKSPGDSFCFWSAFQNLGLKVVSNLTVYIMPDGFPYCFENLTYPMLTKYLYLYAILACFNVAELTQSRDFN